MTSASLPADILNIELIKYLSVPTFLRYCSTNRSFAQLCNRDDIWYYFLRRDYPLYPYSGPYPRVIYMLLSKFIQQNDYLDREGIRRILELDPRVLTFISVLPASKFSSIKSITSLEIEFQLRPETLLTVFSNESISIDLEERSNNRQVKLSMRINNDPVRHYLRVIRDYLQIPTSEILQNPNVLVKVVEPLVTELNLPRDYNPRAGSQYRWFSLPKGRIDISTLESRNTYSVKGNRLELPTEIIQSAGGRYSFLFK